MPWSNPYITHPPLICGCPGCLGDTFWLLRIRIFATGTQPSTRPVPYCLIPFSHISMSDFLACRCCVAHRTRLGSERGENIGVLALTCVDKITGMQNGFFLTWLRLVPLGFGVCVLRERVDGWTVDWRVRLLSLSGTIFLSVNFFCRNMFLVSSSRETLVVYVSNPPFVSPWCLFIFSVLSDQEVVGGVPTMLAGWLLVRFGGLDS